MKLRFTPRAARDLAEIAAYIREHSPQAATCGNQFLNRCRV
jgi:plasmid stabilization system protein ParE